MDLAGKVVLITGASQGIGAACAQALREKRARLALTARTDGKLRQVAAPEDLVLPGDITVPADREQIVQQTLERFGNDRVAAARALGLDPDALQAKLKDFNIA